MAAVDPAADTWLYDDRSKTRDLLKVAAVLWTDGRRALCRVEKAASDSDFAFSLGDDMELPPMLIDLADGAVALSMCGAATSFVVRGDYDEVMRLWLRAKDIVPGTAARADGEGGHV